MTTFLTDANKLLNVILQLVLIAAPIIVSWLIRTYMRSGSAVRKLEVITRLSNMAINFVENLDRRGDLTLPSEVHKGAYKLQVASNWLSHELERQGIAISGKQAQGWVAAEFQKQVGDVRPVARIEDLTRAAVSMVRQLQDNDKIHPPPTQDATSYAAELAADAIVVGLSQQGVTITRDMAISWARAELVRVLHAQLSEQNTARLTSLVEFASTSEQA